MKHLRNGRRGSKMRIKVGSIVKVDHPITCLNPDEYFAIAQIEFQSNPKKVWICGENTCWFNSDMIVDVKDD